MDRPPGGWSELVTVSTLDARLAAMRHEILAEMHREFAGIHRELRDQTWRLMAIVVTAMGVMTVVRQAPLRRRIVSHPSAILSFVAPDGRRRLAPAGRNE